MRKADATPYLILADAHVGFEKKPVNGVMKNSPTHNPAAIAAALQFQEYFDPQIVVLAGDQGDYVEVSHHNRRKPRLKEGFRLKDTIEQIDSVLVKPIELRASRRCKKVWIDGNHERFIQDFVDEFPELEGYLDIASLLGLEQRGWTVVPLGGIYQIGKNNVLHGEKIKGKNPAEAALARYRRSVRFGHFHTASEAVDKQPFDRPDDRHTAKGIPCLRNLNPGWMLDETHGWLNGMLPGWVNLKTGEFTDWIIEMYGDKFYFDGREFNGRSLARDLR